MDDKTVLLGVWERARTRFDRDDTLRPQHKAWLSLTQPLALVQDTVVLGAPNEFAREYLDSRLRHYLVAVLSEELGHDIQIAVTVLSPDEQIPSVTPPGGGGDEPRGTGGYGRTEYSHGSDYGRPDYGSSEPERHADPYRGDTFGGGDTFSGVDQNGERTGRRANGGHNGYQDTGYPDTNYQDTNYQDPDYHDSGYQNDTFPHGGPGTGPPRPNGRAGAQRTGDPRDTRLNPKYTFDTFVIGASNRFTHAAAVAVAEAPAKAYNPLFVYGESGLGKTHLLHAIGHYAQRLLPGLRTRYVSSEEFTNDFINSVRDDKMQAFQVRYRSVDLLLIDDIQFLERAERTQEEFFHTFNTLHNANKQIVISSDKSPRQLHSLEDRLRTRFEWGLISDVQAPDLETRIAILRKKAAQDGMNLPPEVLEFIATRIQSNIRELEGALIRVTAFASLNRQSVDISVTQNVLKDLVGELDGPEITASTIMGITAEYFGVSMDELVGPSRSRAIVHARQMSMYLCRELTDLSLPRIGEKFGDRDHTTVMHAERKIRLQMGEKLTTYNQIAELTARIRLRSRP